jgi:hypothetical protein
MESNLCLARFVTTVVHMPQHGRLFFRVRCGDATKAALLQAYLGQGRVRAGSVELEGAGTGLALTALGVPANVGNTIEEWYLARAEKRDLTAVEARIAREWNDLLE